MELPELASARCVALYAAIGDEVNVAAACTALRARGVRTLLPVWEGDALALAVAAAGAALRSVRRGPAEPPADAPRVDVAEVDAFVVPGLLFDRALRRLGRGGGHYDRLLARAREDAPCIGICYADRVIEELPQDPWDVRMHVVVTERFVLRRARTS